MVCVPRWLGSFLFYLLIYKHLGQHFTHSRHLIKIYQMTEWKYGKLLDVTLQLELRGTVGDLYR